MKLIAAFVYLRKCIDNFKVIHYHPHQEGKVMFGAWVEVENIDRGLKRRFRIVGIRRDYWQ